MNIAALKDKVNSGQEYVKDKEREENEKYSAALEYANTQNDVCGILLECYKKIIGVLKKVCYIKKYILLLYNKIVLSQKMNVSFFLLLQSPPQRRARPLYFRHSLISPVVRDHVFPLLSNTYSLYDTLDRPIGLCPSAWSTCTFRLPGARQFVDIPKPPQLAFLYVHL